MGITPESPEPTAPPRRATAVVSRRDQGWVREEWIEEEPTRRVPAWVRVVAFVVVCAILGALVSTLLVAALNDDDTEQTSARIAELEEENASLRAELASTTTRPATAPTTTRATAAAGGAPTTVASAAPLPTAAGNGPATAPAPVPVTEVATTAAAPAVTATTPTTVLATPTTARQDLDPTSATCGDFPNWDEADIYYWDQYDLYDEDRTTLDPDGDSIPCEDLPDAP